MNFPFFKAHVVAALWEKYSQQAPLSRLAEGNPVCLKAHAAQNSVPIREVLLGRTVHLLAGIWGTGTYKVAPLPCTQHTCRFSGRLGRVFSIAVHACLIFHVCVI